MNSVQLWAAVRFNAHNGDIEGLLSDAAQAGVHLYEITPLPGGFQAGCCAWRYPAFATLARRRHTRLRVEKRYGMYFVFRPLLRRRGLWIGLITFLPILLLAQHLVWAVSYGQLTSGQQARISAALRETRLAPGAIVNNELLTAGEYSLMRSGEFSWVSLNFFGGKLTVEAADANPTPKIFSGRLQGLNAAYSGVIVDIALKSGTALVTPGQEVAAGQELIGTARYERDGTPVFVPAAGKVLARFEWQEEYYQPLAEDTQMLSGQTVTYRILQTAGLAVKLPSMSIHGIGQNDSQKMRHIQLSIAGLPLPILIEETTIYQSTVQRLVYTEEQALALVRMHSLQQLRSEHPDAEIIAHGESIAIEDDVMHCTVTYTIIADIVKKA